MTDSPHLNNWPISCETPVAWGEMDALQHVNNIVYMRWFETARMAYFGALDMLGESAAEGVGPILASTTINYRLPVTWPDQMRIEATVQSLGRTSFVMGHRVFSEKHQTICAEGTAVVVLVNYKSGEKVPLSDALRARIHALESPK